MQRRGRRKRGGTEITTTAGPGRPCLLPLCSMRKSAHREQQLPPGPTTSPTPAASCAEAGATRSSQAAFCSLQNCPRAKAQQQGEKHPMSYGLNYGERHQYIHVRNSNYLPSHRNIASLTKSLFSLKSIHYASVFSDHLAAAQHHQSHIKLRQQLCAVS